MWTRLCNRVGWGGVVNADARSGELATPCGVAGGGQVRCVVWKQLVAV
jgi:hypothetical protein